MKEYPEHFGLKMQKCPKCGNKVDDIEYDPQERIVFATCSKKDFKKEVFWL